MYGSAIPDQTSPALPAQGEVVSSLGSLQSGEEPAVKIASETMIGQDGTTRIVSDVAINPGTGTGPLSGSAGPPGPAGPTGPAGPVGPAGTPGSVVVQSQGQGIIATVYMKGKLEIFVHPRWNQLHSLGEGHVSRH